MKFIGNVAKYALSRQFQSPRLTRAFSASSLPDYDFRQNLYSSASFDDLQRRVLNDGNTPNASSFYNKLDKAEKAYDQSGMGSIFNLGNKSDPMDNLDESFDSSKDGMDLKIKNAATYFEFDPDEITREDYSFRPDVNFSSGTTYDTKDLDLKNPGVRKPFKRAEFETTTEEVLRKADFRNVRFLSNFITEAGIINKRSKMGISAKAQRKIAREIKTARAFGLLPFTTMGTKQFVFNKTMEDLDADFEYENYDRNFVVDEEAE